MPIIRVEMFEGKTNDQKRTLVKELTKGFTIACGGQPDKIHEVINEISKECWALGGELCSEKN